jgi:hypothetical protein
MHDRAHNGLARKAAAHHGRSRGGLLWYKLPGMGDATCRARSDGRTPDRRTSRTTPPKRRPTLLLLTFALLGALFACSPTRPTAPQAPGAPDLLTAVEPRTAEPGTIGGAPWGPMQPGIDQPTRVLSPSEILAMPWDTLDGPFKEFGIGGTPRHPDLPPARPYAVGASTVCGATITVGNHPANQIDFTPHLFGTYSAGVSSAIGTLPDGLQYFVITGPPDDSHLDEVQRSGLLQRYSGLVLLQVRSNCPFPQFLPEQRWLAAGTIAYYDPTNRGAIVLDGAVSGHVLGYKYKQADGQIDPMLHYFDFETGTFT